MTNLQSFLSSAPSLGNIVGFTTVWNFHHVHVGEIARKKGTNINTFIEKMKKEGLKGGFTLYVDQIGWSGHSASRVAVIEGTTNDEECGQYHSTRVCEIFIK